MEHVHHESSEHLHDSMMRMYFHGGYEDQFLFEKLSIDGPYKMVMICGALFALSIIYEAIKYVRCVSCGCRASKPDDVSANNRNLAGDLQDNETTVRLSHNCYVGRLRTRRHRLIQALLHTLQTALGFLLMLCVMSFNVCIIFAIVLGNGVGYYVFYRSYNEIEAIDSCH